MLYDRDGSVSLDGHAVLNLLSSVYIAETVLSIVLKESILKFLKLDGILANLTGYVETRVELMKIEVKEDVARTLAKAVVFIGLSFIFTLVVLFISAAVAYKIAETTGLFVGFSIVAGFYLLLALILWMSREPLTKKLEDQFMETINPKKQK